MSNSGLIGKLYYHMIRDFQLNTIPLCLLSYLPYPMIHVQSDPFRIFDNAYGNEKLIEESAHFDRVIDILPSFCIRAV